MKKLVYRPEIDGLRAIAVLAVVVFHAGVNSLPGGFIGVDIFYVISGYLISSIILNALENGTFSLQSFYIRRVKRLLPAATAMIVSVALLGYVLLTPENYIALAKSAIFSNLFLANFWFAGNSGYFDQASSIAPLVHMWSLAVEEQFYLVFPVLIVLVYKHFRLFGVGIVVSLITLCSFALSVFLSEKNASFSFYMLPTRAWELGLGVLLSMLPRGLIKNSWPLIGTSLMAVLAIVYGLLSITENNAYPSYWAAFPVLGTVLLIWASEYDRSLLKPFLSVSPLVFVGRISYSVYLWHWPIIVFYRTYISERSFSALESVLLILSSLVAGYISWRFIEERFRHGQYSNKSVCSAVIAVTLLVTSLGSTILYFKGFPERLSSDAIAMTDQGVMWEWECTERVKLFPELNESFCIIGKPWDESDMKGLVWGDSHSQHWAPIIHKEAMRRGMSLAVAPRKCPPFLDSDYVAEHYPKFPEFTDMCTQRNRIAYKFISENRDVEVIILAAAWSGHVRMLYSKDIVTNFSNASLENKSAKDGAAASSIAFEKFLAKLEDKRVLILGDFPRPNRVLNECAARDISKIIREKCDDFSYKKIDAERIKEWHFASDSLMNDMAKRFSNVSLILPGDYLCNAAYCNTYVNGEFIYRDGNHIRRNMSSETIQEISLNIGLRDYFSSL